MNAGPKWFWNLITDRYEYKIFSKHDECGYKINFKLDNWLMRVQNYCKSWYLIDTVTNLFWNLIIDWFRYKIIMKLDN